MRNIQKVIERIKVFFQNYANNSSHTLSSDIKEFIATYVLSLGYYILYILPQRNELKRTQKLKNTKKGKKCFVFANGPSMNLLDVEKIERYQKAGFEVICVNSYIISDMAKTVVPDYYVLSDPTYFAPYQDVIDAEKRQIARLIELKILVFIPAQFSNRNLFKHNCIFNDFENRFNRNIDPIKPRGYRTMTAYKALAIACYMGYEKIYICGFDNDYFKALSVDENNYVYYIDKHFYDDEIKYRATPGVGEGLADILWEHYRLFKDMDLFRQFNIINLNKNGLIDTFSKKPDIDIYCDDK
jgi:hypothetical protein